MKETPIKERPILFSTPMVQGTRDGIKTQTRRTRGLEILNQTPDFWNTVRPLQRFENVVDLFDDEPQEFPGADANSWIALNDPRGLTDGGYNVFSCPYGAVGDRLWVRETWRMFGWATDVATVIYKASERKSFTEMSETFPVKGKKYIKPGMNWKPSIHMPRWASRLTLEITDINVERLQDISEEDAIAEGVEPEPWADIQADGELRSGPSVAYRAGFHQLWDQINGKKHPWASNPWVWKISFRKVEGI